MRIAFTVRKAYFDAIRSGEKTREVRRASVYWTGIVARVSVALGRGERVEATFLCGPRWHHREIIGVEWYANSINALGREPSEQGRKDLGDGAVFGFDLGAEIKR